MGLLSVTARAGQPGVNSSDMNHAAAPVALDNWLDNLGGHRGGHDRTPAPRAVQPLLVAVAAAAVPDTLATVSVAVRRRPIAGLSRFFPATLEVGRFPGTQDCMGTLVRGPVTGPRTAGSCARQGSVGRTVRGGWVSRAWWCRWRCSGRGRTRPATTWPGRPTAPPTTTSGPSRSGRWAGSGAAAAGLTGRLDAAGATTLRGAARGYDAGRAAAGGAGAAGRPPRPTPGRPAGRRGPGPRRHTRACRSRRCSRTRPIGPGYAALATRVARPGKRGRAATVDPARAGQLAAAAGLDVAAVYGTGRAIAEAMRFAGRRVDHRRPGIDVTVSAPKSRERAVRAG